jgi:hypothetical protein
MLLTKHLVIVAINEQNQSDGFTSLDRKGLAAIGSTLEEIAKALTVIHIWE